jgi:hypothetical protein
MRPGLHKMQGEVLENPKKEDEGGRRPEIEHRGFEDLAGRSSEEARDAATTGSAYF